MTMRLPSVLCPVDFSEPSRSALCYAAAVADHFGARLTVLSVDDPLLANAAAMSLRVPSLEAETLQELRRFCSETLSPFTAGPKNVDYRTAIGKPAAEILRAAKELASDLIVISSRGRSGIRKTFFGSTTERVLRETTVPVLITPDERRPALSLSEIAGHIDRVLAPVDLTGATPHQLEVAAGIAGALSVPLIVLNVLEPIFVPYSVRMAVTGVEADRREEVEAKLAEIAQPFASRVRVESMVLTGEPSEEIVTLAKARRANLIVMGLHSSGMLGPRMGSVTYRVLCLTHSLVLAIPPSVAGVAAQAEREHSSLAVG